MPENNFGKESSKSGFRDFEEGEFKNIVDLAKHTGKNEANIGSLKENVSKIENKVDSLVNNSIAEIEKKMEKISDSLIKIEVEFKTIKKFILYPVAVGVFYAIVKDLLKEFFL